MNIACATTFHRHQLTCGKCGVSDDSRGPIAETPTRSGRPWEPTCATCSGKVQKRERIAAVAKT